MADAEPRFTSDEDPGGHAPTVDWLAADRRALDVVLDRARTLAGERLARLDEAPAGRVLDELPVDDLPVGGIGAVAAMQRLASTWLPTFSGSGGPRHLGFVTGGATPAALAGDWLASAWDQNLVHAGESGAAALSAATVDLLRRLLGLPEALRGAMVTGATASAIAGLACARAFVAEARGVDVAHEGVAALGPVHVLSGTPHGSIGKALSVLGLGRGALRRVDTLPGREALDPRALVAALTEVAEAAEGPAIVVGNAGTVNTCDVDDLVAVARACEEHGAWLHVDAAFAGLAAVSPRQRPLLTGWDRADSITVDAHKWLNVPYDAGVVLTRRPDLLRATFRLEGDDLPALDGAVDLAAPMHLVPESSQRLRALPLWLSLVAYGRAGHEALVDRCCAHAVRFGQLVYDEPWLELLAPVRLNGVCLAVRERAEGGAPTLDVAGTRSVLDRLTASGEAFLTSTVLRGQPAVRASFTSWRTTTADVDRVFRALVDAATDVVGRAP